MKGRLLFFITAVVITTVLTACGRHIAQQKTFNPNTTYLCPMHKVVVSSKPGKCPKCGMNLVSFEDYRNSKSGNPSQNRMPDTHSGVAAVAEAMQVIINHSTLYDKEKTFYWNINSCHDGHDGADADQGVLDVYT